MTHRSSIEKQLGFDYIREALKGNCLTAAGQGKVEQLGYRTSHSEIITLLEENVEMMRLLQSGAPYPFEYFIDPSAWLDKIKPEGGYLESRECLQLGQALSTLDQWVSMLSKDHEAYPRHADVARELPPPLVGHKDIFKVVDENGEVRDNASEELRAIRKSLAGQQSRLRRLNEEAFRAAVEGGFVPGGALPTIREGRMVIPILAIHKRKFKGLVLDESSSGQTVFMEPAHLVEVNNELKELALAERREVIRILKNLAGRLRQEMPWLVQSFEFMAYLDLNRSRARVAEQLGSVMPHVSERPVLEWVDARHPMLIRSLKGKRELIPLSIKLEESARMMLISGPNAGGKSVCLKTVGLLQYMLQCGLLVPAGADSKFGIFDELYVDIGDQQSIENDLSTYSSHLANMRRFMDQATSRSLVLMDELGSGTDPNFGGAIAQAVLEVLLRKQAWGLATTHYYNLKLFASERTDIRNASMRFDETKLEPLYKLDIGKPGSSYALEIARKTGMPGVVLSRAEAIAGEHLTGLEKLLRDVQQQRQELDERLEQQTAKETALNEELNRHRQLASELESRKKEILQKARVEADSLLRRTNKEIEKTIRHIKENSAERKETRKIRKQLEGIVEEIKAGPPEAVNPAEAVKIGDYVRIPGQQGSGIVVALRNGRAVVQFGEVATTVSLTGLVRAEGVRVSKESASKGGFDLPSRQAQFEGRLDLRGRRAEEVAPLLQQFLDDGSLLGYNQLTILHGKGEGVLRQVVRDYLRKDDRVAHFADEHVERGGTGVTVVNLG